MVTRGGGFVPFAKALPFFTSVADEALSTAVSGGGRTAWFFGAAAEDAAAESSLAGLVCRTPDLVGESLDMCAEYTVGPPWSASSFAFS